MAHYLTLMVTISHSVVILLRLLLRTDCPRDVRHDRLRDALFHICRSDCGFQTVRTERPVSSHRDDQRRMDVVLSRFPHDTSTSWIDFGVTMVVPEDLDFSSHLPRLTVPGHSALAYGRAKVTKYRDAITPSVHFIPGIADVFGFWHPDIIAFITGNFFRTQRSTFLLL